MLLECCRLLIPYWTGLYKLTCARLLLESLTKITANKKLGWPEWLLGEKNPTVSYFNFEYFHFVIAKRLGGGGASLSWPGLASLPMLRQWLLFHFFLSQHRRLTWYLSEESMYHGILSLSKIIIIILKKKNRELRSLLEKLHMGNLNVPATFKHS